MMAITHAAIAAAGVGFALGDCSPIVLGVAIAGSQLPDLDTSTSTIGQILFPISRWLEKRWPHRSITHSFLATIAIALVSLVVWFYCGWKIWVALWLGHLISCFSDTFTKQGVQLFFPIPVWCICGSNPNKRLTTGGPGEYWVLAGAVALLLINIQFTGNGGFVRTVASSIGIRDEAMQVYNSESASHHVYAEIQGFWSHDRAKADGKFFVIGAEGTEFVVSDSRGIYKTGQQIIITKLSTVLGVKAATLTQPISLSDSDPIAPLRKLQLENPNAAIYLSGTITIDAGDEIRQPRQKGFQTMVVAANSIVLNHHPLEQALTQLSGQFATGTLTAKIITPRPTYETSYLPAAGDAANRMCRAGDFTDPSISSGKFPSISSGKFPSISSGSSAG